MSDIKDQMKTGLFWTALDRYSNFFISLAISMVLARLLTPYDFGVVATASVLLAFLTMFTSVGIAPAIIQRQDLTNEEIDHIFTFTILLGLLLGALSFVTSWPIANFYGNSLLKPIVQILSIGLLLSSINIVPAALMSKNLRFKQMATRSIAFNLFFGIIGIVFAFYGAGVYALIYPQIAASLCTFIYNSHFYPVHVKVHFSLNPIKKIFSYSVYIFLTNFGNYLGRNLDKLIIGKAISTEALGYYDKSYRLMQMPMTYISTVLTPVMQPILSKLQDDFEEMTVKFTKIVGVVASLSFPVAVILYFSAKNIIIVFFGEMWLPSVPAFKILSLSIPFTLINSPFGPAFLACNATKEMFRLSLIEYPFFFLVLMIAAIWGKTVESFAWAWVLNEAFCLLLSFYVLYIKVLKSSMVYFFKVLLYPFINTIILVVIYVLLGMLLPKGLHDFVQMIIKLIIGSIFVLIYFQLMGIFDVYAFIKATISKKFVEPNNK